MIRFFHIFNNIFMSHFLNIRRIVIINIKIAKDNKSEEIEMIHVTKVYLFV